MNKKTRVFIISALMSLTMLANVSFAEQTWQGPDQVLAAAKAGDAEAQLEMGILYEYGFFLSENKAPAHAWYSLAAEQGNVKAVRLKDKLEAAMTSDEIRQAEELRPTLGVVAVPRPSTAPEAAPTAPETQAPAVPEATAEPLPQNGQQEAAPADDGVPTIK